MKQVCRVCTYNRVSSGRLFRDTRDNALMLLWLRYLEKKKIGTIYFKTMVRDWCEELNE